MADLDEEDTPRQRMRIGLPPDWVTPRGEEIQPKVDAFNPDYRPGGGERKIFHEKVEIQTGSKINSLENQDYQPGGGNKPIFNERLEFQKEAKPKLGSLENAEYKPGGGDKKFVFSERLKWTDKPVLNTRENIDYQTRRSNLRIFSDQLDFTEKAKPKVGSLDNKDYEPRRPGIRVYHERLPWLEHDSNRPRLRRGSGDNYPGGSYESRRSYAEEMEERAKRQDGAGASRGKTHRRATSEEAAQRAALRERQREFAERTAAEAAAKPAATRQRRLPNERDPKQPDAAAEAAAAERKRRQQQLQEEKERREQRQRQQQEQLQKQEEQQRQQQQQLQQQKQLEQQKQKEQREKEKKEREQRRQLGNNSQAPQKPSGEAKAAAKKDVAAAEGRSGSDGMAKQKQPKAVAAPKQQQQQQQQTVKKTPPPEQKQQSKQPQQPQREPDEWEYARHEFDRPRQTSPDKAKKKDGKADRKASDEAAASVPPLDLPQPDETQQPEESGTSRGAKDLYKTEGYAKRFELAPASVTNRSLILAPLENYRHDWNEDAEVKVRMDGEGRLVLKSNRKVPTRLPRVAETDLPAPATYVSSISKKERPLYDPKPKLVTGEDLGHLLPRLENLLETPAAPKKHYSQYSVDKRPGRQPGYGETMQRQQERHGYRVNPEGERVALISSDDYNNQFYSEVRVRDAQLEPRTTGQYARNFEQQQQPAQQQQAEPQPDELSDRLMLQPSEQLPHYRPDAELAAQPPAASSSVMDFGDYYADDPDAVTVSNSSQAGGRAQQQRRQRRFVNWKPGEVLYATGDRPAGGPADGTTAYSEKLKKQRQQQQLQQQQQQGFSGLHEQRKNWYRDYNQRMLAREGNVEKVSERDLLHTTYELY